MTVVDRHAAEFLLASCLAAACAAGPAAEPTTTVGGFGHQWLYRVAFSGAGPDGGGRVALYFESDDRFRLAASDPLGRALWELDVDGGTYLLVDRREESFCFGGGALALPGLDLESMPVSSLARILTGRPPVVGLKEGADQRLGDADRVWSVDYDGAEMVSWSLAEAGRPVLWWTRQDRGGILSHRRGDQFRWREVVSEGLREPLATTPRPPAGFDESICDETFLLQLREDQPPPTGAGTKA